MNTYVFQCPRKASVQNSNLPPLFLEYAFSQVNLVSPRGDITTTSYIEVLIIFFFHSTGTILILLCGCSIQAVFSLKKKLAVLIHIAHC